MNPINRRQCGHSFGHVLPLLIVFLFGAVWRTGPANAAPAAAIIVTSSADSGPGTLRAAIDAANANPDADIITFNLAGSTIITPATALPFITSPVEIRGESQAGAICDNDPRGSDVRVVLDGTNAGFLASAFVITGTGVRVSGLNLRNFNGYGIFLDAIDAQIVCNFIGTNLAGTAPAPNRGGILINSSNASKLPQRIAILNNVIMGNQFDGIAVYAARLVNIEGNHIGTDVNGLQAPGNGQHGIVISGAAHQNTIRSNVVSGNAAAGILIDDANRTIIDGNVVGTNISGTAALANQGLAGIFLLNAAQNTIGYADGGLGNLISGNNSSGIRIVGTASTTNTISNNRIGTNSSATVAIPNGFDGISLFSSPAHNSITGNIISGNAFNGIRAAPASNTDISMNSIGITGDEVTALANGQNGVFLDQDSNRNTITANIMSGNTLAGIAIHRGISNTVQNNFIGTNGSTTAALPNGSSGIRLSGAGAYAARTQIVKNFVSGNTGAGIHLLFAGNNQLSGNRIGTGAGNVPLGNQSAGILIQDSSNNMIGDANLPQNVIANNGNAGISISGVSSGNAITQNSVYSNSGLGIDVSPAGVTPNDLGDSDSGPNGLQNYPVLSGSVSSGVVTLVSGTLNSSASTPFLIEFFSNAAAEADGTCEGAVFVGSALVTSTVNGTAAFDTVLSAGVPSGHKLSATVKNLLTADTSEFSACTTVLAAVPTARLNPLNRTVRENAGTAALSVHLSIAMTMPITITFSSSANAFPGPTDAGAGTDFVSVTNGSVVIAAEQLSATLLIPIIDDALVEQSETFFVRIELPAGSRATLDPSKAASIVTIEDNDGVPTANKKVYLPLAVR